MIGCSPFLAFRLNGPQKVQISTICPVCPIVKSLSMNSLMGFDISYTVKDFRDIMRPVQASLVPRCHACLEARRQSCFATIWRRRSTGLVHISVCMVDDRSVFSVGMTDQISSPKSQIRSVTSPKGHQSEGSQVRTFHAILVRFLEESYFQIVRNPRVLLYTTQTTETIIAKIVRFGRVKKISIDSHLYAFCSDVINTVVILNYL